MRDAKKIEIAGFNKMKEIEDLKGDKTKTEDYNEGFNDCLAIIFSAFDLRRK